MPASKCQNGEPESHSGSPLPYRFTQFLPPLIFPAFRTGVRVAEGAGLENRYTRKGIVGSNPTLSVSPKR